VSFAGSRRIAVLFHAGDRDTNLSGYIVDHLARAWREDGYEVVYLFGTRRFVPADLVLVHVNLSVVPDEYLEFAARYPIALNGRLKDIRKSTTSRNLVRAGDPWDGPVIVKSDLNFGGSPERILHESWLHRRSKPWRGVKRVTSHLSGRANPAPFSDWRDYLIYERLSDVPLEWFDTPDAVIERFRPELNDGLYHLRMYQFLGDRWSCTRLSSPDPLIKAQTSVDVEQIEPHPDVRRWRAELEMDYGKLDYVVNDGEAVLLDVNKTTGASSHIEDAELRRMRRYQAEGLYRYFDTAPELLRGGEAAVQASTANGRRSRSIATQNRPLRVMVSSLSSEEDDNPYVRLLARALRKQDVEVEHYGLSGLTMTPPDIVHIHWPEFLLYGRTPWRELDGIRQLLVMRGARWRGTKLVWTVHNVSPHDHDGAFVRAFINSFSRSVDLAIVMTRSSPAQVAETTGHEPREVAFIPHGHYRGIYLGEDMGRDEARERLGVAGDGPMFLFFGQIRPYKGIENLLHAFSRVDNAEARLIIAGLPRSTTIRQTLEERAARDRRIHLRLDSIPSAQVSRYFRAADLTVLPYRKLTNSGVALLSLSLNRMVLGPPVGSIIDLQEELGERWVQVFRGELTADDLTRAGEVATLLRDEEVDLSAFDWDTIGISTVDAYRRALGR
jgi:glycosyltransferase involved in cell wall biosynthesis